MMKELDADRITKEIFRDSILELEDPDFNQNLMNKIKKEAKLNSMKYKILNFTFIFAFTNALILLLLRLFDIPLDHIYTGVKQLGYKLLMNSENMGLSFADGNMLMLLFTFALLPIIMNLITSFNLGRNS